MRERDPMPDDRRERYGARQRSDESYWSEHGYGYGPGYDLELMKPLIRGNGHDREKGSHFAQRTRDVMTHYVITIHPWETIQRAAQILYECDCGALPVVNNSGQLMGMVTDRDIALRIIGRGIDPRRARVEDCMTSEAIACRDDDSIESCMRQMSRHQLRRVPIVDGRDCVIGIVSQSDLARHAGTHPEHGERRAVADVLCAISEPTHMSHR